MEFKNIILKEFTDEMNTTRKFLENISLDLFDYKPHEKSKTYGQLVNHMIPISSWIPAITNNLELDWSKITPPAVLTSKSEILRQFEKNIVIGEKALKETNNDQLLDFWVMRNGETIMFSGTKETAIRRYVMNHTIHHRAQLGVYFRLNEKAVPASYVSSADEKLF